MNEVVIKVLAVADPAVFVYVNKKYTIFNGFKKARIEFDIVAWENYYPAVVKALEGKSEYDIVMVAGHLWLCDFVEKGYLWQIDKYDNDILPIIANEMQYKGKNYLSPSFCDGHMIVYRKSILKKAGIEFGNVITVDELLTAVNAIRDLPKGMNPIALKAHPTEIFLDALPFLRSGGSDVYDIDTYKSNCNSNDVINGLLKYLSLRDYAHIDTRRYANNEIKEAIAQKKAAIGVTWSGQLGLVFDENCIEPDDLGFTTFNTAWNVTWSFGICNTSKNKAISKELLKYLCSKEVDKIAGELSGAPIRKSNYIEGENKYKWYNCQLKMIEECAKPLPNIYNAGVKNSILYDEIYKSFIGEKDAKNALMSAQIRIDAV